MYNFPMVDLAGQYKAIQEEIDNGILQVLKNTQYINGPQVAEFKTNLEKYLGVKHVIPCANGTDALQLALMALDLKPGDEVIAPSFTFVATAEVIALLGLTPILVDVDPKTFCLDIAEVEKVITPKTKAIVPVHLFGHSAEMEPLLALAKKHKIFVVEDNAQAIGGDYTFSDGKKVKTGTMGEFGCTSFFPSKNLGCYGDGGALFTNDDELANKARIMANHGMETRYYHDYVGINSRLDTIQAVVLNAKLKHLDQYGAARQKAAQLYSDKLSAMGKFQVPFIADYSTHVFHQYTVVAESQELRDNIISHLQSKGISCAVYYPVPLHKQVAYKSEQQLVQRLESQMKLYTTTTIHLFDSRVFHRHGQPTTTSHSSNHFFKVQA